jgi:hypothetical protein
MINQTHLSNAAATLEASADPCGGTQARTMYGE